MVFILWHLVRQRFIPDRFHFDLRVSPVALPYAGVGGFVMSQNGYQKLTFLIYRVTAKVFPLHKKP